MSGQLTLIIVVAFTLGGIAVAAYVFTLAARRYVSGEDEPATECVAEAPDSAPGQQRPKSIPADRRSGRRAVFPMTVNGIVIESDRRQRT